jgi:hypothetical protein
LVRRFVSAKEAHIFFERCKNAKSAATFTTEQ